MFLVDFLKYVVVCVNVCFDECSYSKSQCTQQRSYDEEEVQVAHRFLQKKSGNHARQHHAKCHEAGAEGIVGCCRFTFGKVHQVEHVGSKAESIAKLFDEHANAYPKQAFGVESRLNQCKRHRAM